MFYFVGQIPSLKKRFAVTLSQFGFLLGKSLTASFEMGEWNCEHRLRLLWTMKSSMFVYLLANMRLHVKSVSWQEMHLTQLANLLWCVLLLYMRRCVCFFMPGSSCCFFPLSRWLPPSEVKTDLRSSSFLPFTLEQTESL